LHPPARFNRYAENPTLIGIAWLVNLGHSSQAIHRAYAKKARVICPPLETFEKEFAAKKIVKFRPERAA